MSDTSVQSPPAEAALQRESADATWLVTGGAGFVGSALVRQLISETDVRVVNVDALTYAGNLDSLGDALHHERHTFVQADVTNAESMRSLLATHRPSVVVHLAAETHVDRSIDSPEAFLRTNVVGAFTMLEAVRRYWRALPAPRAERFRMLHVSTDEVFGAARTDEAFDEETPYDPSSPYAASKAAADHLVRAWQRTYGVPLLVTNCSNNYGPYQFPEKLIPLMIRKGIAGEPMPVYGDGMQVRDWLHVDDHANALRAVIARGAPGSTYNVGARCERANVHVVQQICALLDELKPLGDASRVSHTALVTYVEDRPAHDRRYAIDPTKIEREIGWRPRYDFDAGLRQTVRWYLDNEAWTRAVTSGAYRGERLGLGLT